MSNTTKSQVNPNFQIPTKPFPFRNKPFTGLAGSWGGAPQKAFTEKKNTFKCFFGKAFFFKERFLIVLGFGICLVVLVYTGIWDFYT